MERKAIVCCMNCRNRIKNNYYPYDYGKCKIDGGIITSCYKTCNNFVLMIDPFLFSKTNIIIE